MIQEIIDKETGAIIFKKDKESLLVEKLLKRVEELEKRIEKLEHKEKEDS